MSLYPHLCWHAAFDLQLHHLKRPRRQLRKMHLLYPPSLQLPPKRRYPTQLASLSIPEHRSPSPVLSHHRRSWWTFPRLPQHQLLLRLQFPQLLHRQSLRQHPFQLPLLLQRRLLPQRPFQLPLLLQRRPLPRCRRAGVKSLPSWISTSATISTGFGTGIPGPIAN